MGKKEIVTPEIHIHTEPLHHKTKKHTEHKEKPKQHHTIHPIQHHANNPVHHIQHVKHQFIPADTAKINEILVDNFVNLQKALTNLSVKFESLSENISKLLNLFEISAKSFSEKISQGLPDIEKDKDFLEKLDKLLDQNKIIAKGITLMEEKIREKISQSSPSAFSTPQFIANQPMQTFAPRPISRPINPAMTQGTYMPSITREEENAAA